MGSTGTGRISDYPGGTQDGDGKNGGDPPPDRCGQAFQTVLEDVEKSDYFAAHSALPPAGTELRLVIAKRVVAQTVAGESVGSVPTSRNYLAACIKDGWSYSGLVVTASPGPPEAKIDASFVPTPP